MGDQLRKKLTDQLAPAVRNPAGGRPVSSGVAKVIAKLVEWRSGF